MIRRAYQHIPKTTHGCSLEGGFLFHASPKAIGILFFPSSDVLSLPMEAAFLETSGTGFLEERSPPVPVPSLWRIQRQIIIPLDLHRYLFPKAPPPIFLFEVSNVIFPQMLFFPFHQQKIPKIPMPPQLFQNAIHSAPTLSTSLLTWMELYYEVEVFVDRYFPSCERWGYSLTSLFVPKNFGPILTCPTILNLPSPLEVLIDWSSGGYSPSHPRTTLMLLFSRVVVIFWSTLILSPLSPSPPTISFSLKQEL